MLLFSVVAEKAEQKERTKVKFMKHFVFFLLTFSMMLSPLLGATEATVPSCTAFYAVKGEEVFNTSRRSCGAARWKIMRVSAFQ